MTKDIINSIKVHMHERSTSPLFGAFAFSWIGWNYQFILTLFSDFKITDKLLFIDNVLYPTIWHNIFLGFVIPLITAVCFIYFYPKPAKEIFKHWRKKQKEMNEERQKIEDETLLSVEDSRKIRQEINQLENKYHEDLEAKESSVKRAEQLTINKTEDLKNVRETLAATKIEIKANEKAISIYEKDINNLKNELLNIENGYRKIQSSTSRKMYLLEFIKKHSTNDGATKEIIKKQLFKTYSIQNEEVDNILNALKDKDLISWEESIPIHNNALLIHLTDKARELFKTIEKNQIDILNEYVSDSYQSKSISDKFWDAYGRSNKNNAEDLSNTIKKLNKEKETFIKEDILDIKNTRDDGSRLNSIAIIILMYLKDNQLISLEQLLKKFGSIKGNESISSVLNILERKKYITTDENEFLYLTNDGKAELNRIL